MLTEEPAPQATVQLCQRLAADLDAGFAELVDSYQAVVYTTLLRACHHPFDAEDLAAEVFLRAYRALRGYSEVRIGELQLRPWLLTIALNTWRNTARDRQRRPAHVSLHQVAEQPAQLDVSETVSARIDLRRELAELISQLPEQQRVAVVLRHVCQLPIGEIAEVLRCPDGTARSHVSRGLSSLRLQLALRQPYRDAVVNGGQPAGADGRWQDVQGREKL